MKPRRRPLRCLDSFQNIFGREIAFNNKTPLSGSMKKIASVTLQREELRMNPSRGHYCIVCCRLLYDIVMIFQHWQSGQDRCL